MSNVRAHQVQLGRNRLLASAFALGSVAIVIAGFFRWQATREEAGYLSGIPRTISVVETVAMDGMSGLREGCGVAVFRISDLTLEKVKDRGLSFFQDASVGRDNGKYFRYQAWQRTPSGRGERVLRALGCAKLDPEIKNAIEQASASSGSYFTVGYEYDLLLIPSKGYIVLSVSG